MSSLIATGTMAPRTRSLDGAVGVVGGGVAGADAGGAVAPAGPVAPGGAANAGLYRPTIISATPRPAVPLNQAVFRLPSKNMFLSSVRLPPA